MIRVLSFLMMVSVALAQLQNCPDKVTNYIAIKSKIESGETIAQVCDCLYDFADGLGFLTGYQFECEQNQDLTTLTWTTTLNSPFCPDCATGCKIANSKPADVCNVVSTPNPTSVPIVGKPEIITVVTLNGSNILVQLGVYPS